MRKRPLLLCACVFVLGLFYEVKQVKWVIGLVAVLAVDAVLPLLKGKRKKWLLRFLVIPLVFFLGTFHMRSQMEFRNAELAQIQEGKDITLCGEIYKKEIKTDQYRVYLKNCYAVSGENRIMCNRVWFSVDSDSYAIGDILWVKGKVNRFKRATNDGAFDMQEYYQSQKIDFAIKSPVIWVEKHAKIAVGEKLWKLKRRVTEVYQRSLSENAAGLMSVMVAGEKSILDEETKELYQAMGISHILAISGLHVSMIGLGIYRFLRKRGIRYVGACSMATNLIVLYAIMTGAGVSTIRATGMLFLLMLSELWGRAYDLLNALGFMCLVLLWDNPFLLGYAGFWLSVIAVFSTATLVKAIQVEKGERINRIYAGIGIWVFTLPLIAFYYYEVPLYSAFLNICIVPLLGVLLFLGIVGAIVGVVGMGVISHWPLATGVILLPCRWILDWYELAAAFCYKLPNASVIVGKPSFRKMILFYLLLFLCFFVWKKWKKLHALRLIGIVISLAIFFGPTKPSFELDMLDVGQGDGCYICTKEGISLFIDGGSSSIHNVGTYQILPFLKSKGIKKISYWFVSHFDEDHVNGLIEVLESGYPVEHFVITAYCDKTEAYELFELARAHKVAVIELRAGQQLCFEQTGITCLGPWEYEKSGNDACLVLRYDDGDFSGIFAGDISEEEEKRIVEKYADSDLLQVAFYKVNHHGSKYSSSKEWLDALSPQLAIISCSLTNMYGHPAVEAVDRIEASGAEIYYTMKGGRIRMKNGEIECFVEE